MHAHEFDLTMVAGTLASCGEYLGPISHSGLTKFASVTLYRWASA